MSRVTSEAFRNWAFYKDGKAIGQMSPSEAARVAFEAALALIPGAEDLLTGKAIAAPEIFKPIMEELARATAKFPTWPTDPLHAMAVLGEEYGELNKEVMQLVYEPHKTTPDEIRKEAIQTAAMSLRFFASLHLYQYRGSHQHSQAPLTYAEAKAA